ncbi:hypothetical protein HUJ04_000099 [Dendroctonus ponderosae]|nr:hypothetical protein HUJ04_000099 [Dendroctonus ponderosae]
MYRLQSPEGELAPRPPSDRLPCKSTREQKQRSPPQGGGIVDGNMEKHVVLVVHAGPKIVPAARQSGALVRQPTTTGNAARNDNSATRKVKSEVRSPCDSKPRLKVWSTHRKVKKKPLG